MELMGLGDNLPGLWRMPSFNKVRGTIDLRQGYCLHRMVLQNLQHRHRGERWVLKKPGHVFYLEHLLAVYPDACIVQTHRDPAKVIPSVTALLVAMRRANSDAPIDATRIAEGNLRAFAAGLDKALLASKNKRQWTRISTTSTFAGSSPTRSARCGQFVDRFALSPERSGSPCDATLARHGREPRRQGKVHARAIRCRRSAARCRVWPAT